MVLIQLHKKLVYPDGLLIAPKTTAKLQHKQTLKRMVTRVNLKDPRVSFLRFFSVCDYLKALWKKVL